MNSLLIALVVLVGLVVLYLVARRVKPFGQSLAFVCTVVSRVNVKLAEYMSKAADYCHTACLASLRYPPGLGDSDYWSGVNVLSRLVYFVLAVFILAGETLNTLLVLPSLFQTANHVQLPGIVELASAALFICAPALLGAVIWECCGLAPRGAGLFPRMNTVTRWVLGILSGVFLVLAILLTGYFYLFRAAYLLDPESTQGMSLYILCGLGVEIAAVSVLALLALVVGGCGVVSLFMWGVEQLCRVIAGCALILPSLLNVVTVHLSHGTRNVFEDYDNPGTYRSPALEFPLLNDASLDAPVEGTIHPILTSEMEEKMRHPYKNATVVLVGSFGTKMFHPVGQAIARLRATESILTSAWLDLAVSHMQTTLPGIVDLSHTPAERNAAMVHGESERQAYTTLLTHLVVSPE